MSNKATDMDTQVEAMLNPEVVVSKLNPSSLRYGRPPRVGTAETVRDELDADEQTVKAGQDFNDSTRLGQDTECPDMPDKSEHPSDSPTGADEELVRFLGLLFVFLVSTTIFVLILNAFGLGAGLITAAGMFWLFFRLFAFMYVS